VKRIRVTVRAEADIIVTVNDDDFAQLVEDDASDFDPEDYGVHIDFDELINGDMVVTDWERVDSRGRGVPDDFEESSVVGGEA
jgi:hypothetical protein